MYPVSNAFHTAVRNGAPQRVLLIFSDMVFTNEDVNVESGVEFHDNFNLEENLAIGQATSNEISFSVFNDARLLNDYAFGDFLATCGALISTETYSGSETARVVTGGKTYTAHATSPYVRVNGSGIGTQPTQKIVSMFCIDGSLYCYGADGSYSIIYNTSNDSVKAGTAHPHMARKAALYWEGKGLSYERNTRMYKEWQNGTASTFECCPFGWFTAERPKAPDVIQIDMTCYDYMQKFEEDYNLELTWPKTIGGLYTSICNAAGVSYATSSFTNSGASIDEEPQEFKTATLRDILKWIAEAAGANARVNRDGVMELRWLVSTNQELDANGYMEFNPCWYETKKVTKLYNRCTQDGTDLIYGSGNEAYLIQDNPLLKGVE